MKFQSAAGLSVPRPDESNPRVDHPDAAPLPIAQRPDVVAPPIPRVVPASNSNNLANNNIDSPKFIPASNHPPAAIDQPGPPSAVIAAIRGEPKPPIAPLPEQIQEENQRQQEVPEAAAAKQEVEKNQLNPAVEEASHREEEGDLPTINDSKR